MKIHLVDLRHQGLGTGKFSPVVGFPTAGTGKPARDLPALANFSRRIEQFKI
ncbi:MAG TPA: hypothetical protein V6D25_18810 [Leptolyngbyaceae cyanobacterium]